MPNEKSCLRCGTEMNHAITEDIQLGRTSWIFGDWPNLIAGAMRVDIYCCPSCGKIEFFAASDPEHSHRDFPQVTCPNCGREHDFDYPRCPFCKYRY